MKQQTITNLNDLLNSPYFDSFQADRLGNDLFINDPERAARIYDAAKEGCDGSTHSEAIEDMRDANKFALDIYRKQFIDLGFEKFCADDLAETLRYYIETEIDEAEQFHAMKGTLHVQIG